MGSEELKSYLKQNCCGRSNAEKSPVLESTLHISGNELRRQVNRLRRRKVPVCSGPEGYFYAKNAGEIYSTIRALKIMTHGLEHAIEGLELALESFGEHAGGDAP